MSCLPLPLDVEDHIRLGNALKQVNHEVRFILSKLRPATTKVGRDGANALATIDKLKWTLDAMLCALVPPPHDPRQLARQVDFGEEPFGLRQHDRTELESDVFAMWAPLSDPRIVSVCPTPPRPLPYDF